MPEPEPRVGPGFQWNADEVGWCLGNRSDIRRSFKDDRSHVKMDMKQYARSYAKLRTSRTTYLDNGGEHAGL